MTAPTFESLAALCADYHGRKGEFAYQAVRWLNAVVFGDALPVTLVQWALTPWGRCLGLTSSRGEAAPVIRLHPAIWEPRGAGLPSAWAARIPAGPRYTLDVVLHELLHVDVMYLRGGLPKGSHSSHDNPVWCEAVEIATSKLRGTLLELPPVIARPTRRLRTERGMHRRTPEGCLSMDDLCHFPHSQRVPDYYRARSTPWE
jgi:hypothetical protein